MPDRDGNAKHAGANPAHRADASAAHLMTAAERFVHFADQVDYSIRRWVVPHDEADRPAAAPMRSSLARQPARASAPRARAARRRDSSLSEMQAAIARALGAEYDLAQPLPDRLVDLLRQIERRSGAGQYRKMAAGRT